MRKTTLVILLAALAALAGVTALVLNRSQPRTQPVAMGEKLFPDLLVNNVAKIVVQAPGARVEVVKTPHGWVVPSRDGYPADFERVARFVRKFADLKIGRTFPAVQGELSRLGLEEPGPAEGLRPAATLLALESAGGETLASLLVGKDRMSKSKQPVRGMPDGQYVRLPGEETVYVVDGYFDKDDRKDAEWLDKTITRVETEEVRSITCRTGTPDFSQEVFAIARPGRGENFEPLVFPTDKKLKTPEVNQLAGLLAVLTLDNVARAEGEAAGFSDAVLAFTLFDGRVYRLYPDRNNPNGTCKLRVTVDYEKPGKSAEPGSLTLTEAGDGAAALAEAENARISPWVFELSSWRCQKIVTDPSALAESPGEPGQ
ncbi:MAG: DUF4340 domain-containing protein [Proteobacteria bacterium]|nr:DUF4340 domain-containing protein [Pseudomonadota bacterium]